MLCRQINFDAGIGEREERHHNKRREIVQRLLQPEDRRGRTFARSFNRKQRFLLSFACQHQRVPRFRAIKIVQQ